MQIQYLTRLTLLLTALSSTKLPLGSRISTSLTLLLLTLRALCVLLRGGASSIARVVERLDGWMSKSNMWMLYFYMVEWMS
jgi:hypothetical protein